MSLSTAPEQLAALHRCFLLGRSSSSSNSISISWWGGRFCPTKPRRGEERRGWSELPFLLCFAVRFIVLSNNYLQIRGIKKTDEGTYRCEGRILARGEINFKDIQVIVNGEGLRAAPHPRLQLHTILFLGSAQ